MPVQKVFWQDPYLKELLASITGVYGDRVTVDRTIAYAFAGGQESDYGTIGGYTILRAEKEDKQVFYTLDKAPGLSVGDEVMIKIDWERRYRLMRLHFAAEIILELVTQHFGNPPKIGAHIAVDKARVDFAWQGNITEAFPLLEREARRLIDSDLAIRSAFSDEESESRFWEIDGFARVACGGTHIGRTGEIGAITLKRNNIGKGKERIEITLV